MYCNLSTNCQMQCNVHPESQVFQNQSIEIVLSSVFMQAWADAKFNNTVIYDRKICTSCTRIISIFDSVLNFSTLQPTGRYQ